MRQQDITYDYKLGELIMDARHPNNAGKVFICVEGESDIRFFRKFFDMDVCKIEQIPGGNSKVEQCTLTLKAIHKLVFGIRDADFLHLSDQPYQAPHMFLTDCHDMEMGMVANDAVFCDVLAEYAPLHERISTNRTEQLALRQHIMQVLEPVSLTKWLNHRDELALTVRQSFVHLLGFPNQQFDFAAWLTLLLKKSSTATLSDIDTIMQKTGQLKQATPDPLQLCNGHDFLETMAEYLRQHMGKKGLKVEDLAVSFRLAFTPACWQQTRLYTQTQAWATEQQCKIY